MRATSQPSRSGCESTNPRCAWSVIPKLGERAKSVHAPVATGQCSFCHEAHESTVAALLNRPVGELCAKCRPAAQLKLVKDHTNPGNADCVRCHDPHRGEQWKLVRTRS